MNHSPGHPAESCRELFARLSEYLDGELDPSLCSGIETHLAECPPCQAFLESLRRTVRLVSSVPDPEIGEDVRREIREAYDRFRHGSGA